jgi:hypothetical protein
LDSTVSSVWGEHIAVPALAESVEAYPKATWRVVSDSIHIVLSTGFYGLRFALGVARRDSLTGIVESFDDVRVVRVHADGSKDTIPDPLAPLTMKRVRCSGNQR